MNAKSEFLCNTSLYDRIDHLEFIQSHNRITWNTGTRRIARRRWIQQSLGTGAALWLPALAYGADEGLRIATFRADVTPPEGQPLCGGWITPVKTLVDELEAIELVILGAGTRGVTELVGEAYR